MSCLLVASLVVGASMGGFANAITSPSASHSSLRDFRISAAQNFLIVQLGSTASTPLNLVSVNGFSGTVEISATIAPLTNGTQGVNLTVNPATVRLRSGGNANSTLVVSTTSTTPGLNFTVTVLAQSSNLSHSINVVIIMPQPNFSLTLFPSSMTVATGSSRTSNLTLASLNGFTGQITLSATSIPINVGIGIGPGQVTLSPGTEAVATIFVNVGSNALPGTYSMTISGTAPFAGGFLTQTAILSLTISQVAVPDFSITSNPNSLTIPRGSLGLVNVTLTSIGGFNGTISMTGSITPTVADGPTFILSPSTVSLAPSASAVSVLQILTNSTTALGSYNFTVTGKTSSLFHSTVGSLLITTGSSGDFSMFTSPSSITTAQNSTRSFGVIALSMSGFAGNVSISTSNIPSGVGVQFLGPSPPVLHVPSGGNGTIIAVLSVGINSVAGNYSIHVTGTSGSLTHTATLLLTISSTVGPNFGIKISPTILTLAQGSAGSINITVTSIGGFTGQVQISDGIIPSVPAGVTFGVSPATLFLSPGGTASTAMKIFTNATATIGTYNVTIGGFSGSLIHQLFGSLIITRAGFESLALINYAFNSTTAVTLNLENMGNLSISFVAYYVKDASGNQYALTAWSGPTISPHTSLATLILIGSSCPSCVLSGSAFTFTPGNAYTVTLVTSRNNQFSFELFR